MFILDHFGKQVIGQTFSITEPFESNDIGLGKGDKEAKAEAKAEPKAKAKAKAEVTHPVVKPESKFHEMSG